MRKYFFRAGLEDAHGPPVVPVSFHANIRAILTSQGSAGQCDSDARAQLDPRRPTVQRRNALLPFCTCPVMS